MTVNLHTFLEVTWLRINVETLQKNVAGAGGGGEEKWGVTKWAQGFLLG